MTDAPLFQTRWSVALVHAVVDVRNGHLRLDVVDPVVVDRVGLGGPGKTDDRGGHSAGDDGGKSELLHPGCLLLSLFGLFSNLIGRSNRLNTVLRELIPLAEIDRRLAGIDHVCASAASPRRDDVVLQVVEHDLGANSRDLPALRQ